MDVHGYKCDQNANPELYRMISCCCCGYTMLQQISTSLWKCESYKLKMKILLQQFTTKQHYARQFVS